MPVCAGLMGALMARKGKAGVQQTLRSWCPPALCGLFAAVLALPAWPVAPADTREFKLPAGPLEWPCCPGWKSSARPARATACRPCVPVRPHASTHRWRTCPQQVSVLTGEALALQGQPSSQEATRYVPGVVLTQGIEFGSGGPGGYGGHILSGMLVRGLNASVALSGMRTVRNLVPVDNAFIDRIEVVKGPTGVLTGVSDLGGRGGVVNLVRKQAGPDVHRDIAQDLIRPRDAGMQAGIEHTVSFASATHRLFMGLDWSAGAMWKPTSFRMASSSWNRWMNCASPCCCRTW